MANTEQNVYSLMKVWGWGQGGHIKSGTGEEEIFGDRQTVRQTERDVIEMDFLCKEVVVVIF